MSNEIPLGIKITADSKQAVPEVKAVVAEEKKLAQEAQEAAKQLQGQNKQLQNNALSAGQMSMALRQVPMQFTDIVVSLQGGQRPLQVLLQQGGQLKDVFGGIGPAVKAMSGYIVGLINPTTVAVAAATALGVAYFEGYKQSQILKDTLVLTGEAAGKTYSQLETLAQKQGQITGQYTTARDAVNQLAASGKFAGEQLDIALSGVMDVSRATGKEISDVVADFVKLAEDPAKAIKTLNEQYNFLTADVYKQIVALQEQGKTQDAATLAIKTFADTMASRKTQVVENAGFIERAWAGIKSAIDGAKESLLSIGRDDTINEKIENARKQLAFLQTKTGYTYDGKAARQGSEAEIAAQERLVAALIKQRDASEALAASKEKTNRQNKEEIAAVDALNKYLGGNNRYSKSGLLAKQLDEENAAFSAATKGLQKNSSEYQQALRAHEQAIANIKESARKKNTGRESKSEAQQMAEDTAKLIQNFQQATAPAQSLSEKLQEQLNKYVALDPAVKTYLQGLIEQTAATEQAKIAQDALNEAIERNNQVMEGLQGYEDADKAKYDSNAKVYADILRETEDMNIAMIENDKERARAQIEIDHQRRVERIANLEGEQDQIDQILAAEEERYRTSVENIGKETKKTKSISQELGLTMKSSFEEAVFSGKKLRDVLSGILEDIAKVLLRKNITEPAAEAIGSFDWGTIFGGSGTIMNAKGNVYPAGDISQYSGSVVNKPTFFTGAPRAFAKGGNVMGEAGSEGIFPLKRMGNGDLGIQAAGGGSNVTVNIIGAPSQPKVTETQDGNGNKSIDVIFEHVKTEMAKDIRKNGPLAQTMQDQYGLSRFGGAK